MERTGHTSTKGVRTYKRISDQQQEATSNILNSKKHKSEDAAADVKNMEPPPIAPSSTAGATHCLFHLAICLRLTLLLLQSHLIFIKHCALGVFSCYDYNNLTNAVDQLMNIIKSKPISIATVFVNCHIGLW